MIFFLVAFALAAEVFEDIVIEVHVDYGLETKRFYRNS